METEKFDWIEKVVAVAARMGCNTIRLRWKLITLQRKYDQSKHTLRERWKHVRYEHQICSGCGAVQDRGEGNCTQCGKKLGPRWLQVLNRTNIKLGARYSSTFLLGLLILLGFWRTCMGAEGFDLNRATSGLALMESGGSLPFKWIRGEWWRFATCIFLHGGLMHLVFNLVALKQIGPDVEETFGRGRMLFFFMITGIIASIGSSLTGSPGVRIGASGAVMGLIGIAAGWGHRSGTRHGIDVRNQMLRWGLYTMVYGYVLGADNVAHGVGFFVGGAIGFLCREQNPRLHSSLGEWALTLTGFVLAVFSLWIIVFQPASFSEMWSNDEPVESFEAEAS